MPLTHLTDYNNMSLINVEYETESEQEEDDAAGSDNEINRTFTEEKRPLHPQDTTIGTQPEPSDQPVDAITNPHSYDP